MNHRRIPGEGLFYPLVVQPQEAAGAEQVQWGFLGASLPLAETTPLVKPGLRYLVFHVCSLHMRACVCRCFACEWACM